MTEAPEKKEYSVFGLIDAVNSHLISIAAEAKEDSSAEFHIPYFVQTANDYVVSKGWKIAKSYIDDKIRVNLIASLERQGLLSLEVREMEGLPLPEKDILSFDVETPDGLVKAGITDSILGVSVRANNVKEAIDIFMRDAISKNSPMDSASNPTYAVYVLADEKTHSFEKGACVRVGDSGVEDYGLLGDALSSMTSDVLSIISAEGLTLVRYCCNAALETSVKDSINAISRASKVMNGVFEECPGLDTDISMFFTVIDPIRKGEGEIARFAVVKVGVMQPGSCKPSEIQAEASKLMSAIRVESVEGKS